MGRYVLFWMHLYALSVFYSSITGVAGFVPGILVGILVLELRSYWNRYWTVSALRKTLTSSVGVAQLDAGEDLTESEV